MRAVLQRVSSASVTVDGDIVGKIGKGVCVLVGLSQDETEADMDYIVRKILSVRIFENEEGKMWTKSVKDLGLEVLCVSQFTLWAKLNGNKPDFHEAMEAARAEPMYNNFLAMMKKAYDPSKIQDGKFGAMMSVSLVNEGPVTLQLDSRKFAYETKPPAHPVKLKGRAAAMAAKNEKKRGPSVEGASDSDTMSVTSITSAP
eukprot:comp21826_c1_seq1/m.31113 comp21826_c1_seq1/g.31113  ORF comp21826_c1_seq1/g.31113 comp21826_c1_seq1/m.31113 type:complete len:201 (-) comp21826_c1_seq1:231-833(-)